MLINQRINFHENIINVSKIVFFIARIDETVVMFKLNSAYAHVQLMHLTLTFITAAVIDTAKEKNSDLSKESSVVFCTPN